MQNQFKKASARDNSNLPPKRRHALIKYNLNFFFKVLATFITSYVHIYFNIVSKDGFVKHKTSHLEYI